MNTEAETCKICNTNPSSIDYRLMKFSPLLIKEPCPTCEHCKEFWLKTVSQFIDSKKNYGSGIYTYENGAVKEISDEEWNKENPQAEALRYHK